MNRAVCGSPLSPAASQVLAAATRRAQSESIGAEHLFLAILGADPSLIGKFKIRHFDRITLVKQMRLVAEAQGQRDAAVIGNILNLSAEIAGNVPVNHQHLLAALLLERSNPVTGFLRKAGVDLQSLLQRRFYFLPRVFDIGQKDSRSNDGSREIHNQNTGPKRPPRFAKPARSRANSRPQSIPRRKPLDHRIGGITCSAEERATQWLSQLIPEQAELYASKKYIEIPSTLYTGTHYRIGKKNRTAMFRNGNKIATCCIHTRDGSMPQTDRVIAEYFFIRGDEARYLKIANVTRFH